MRLRRTMAVADKVARRVGFHLRSFKREDGYGEAYLYPYQNGREHGYALFVELDVPVFIFSENRNSDDIVVYEDSDWSCYGSGAPSEEAYENKKLFRYNEVEKAAKFIARRFKKHVREYDRVMKKKRKEWEKEEAA